MLVLTLHRRFLVANGGRSIPKVMPNDDAAVSIGFSSVLPRLLVVLDVPRESSRSWTVLSGSGREVPYRRMSCFVGRHRFTVYSLFWILDAFSVNQRCRTILSGRCCVCSCYGFPIAVVSGFLPSWDGPDDISVEDNRIE